MTIPLIGILAPPAAPALTTAAADGTLFAGTLAETLANGAPLFSGLPGTPGRTAPGSTDAGVESNQTDASAALPAQEAAPTGAAPTAPTNISAIVSAMPAAPAAIRAAVNDASLDGAPVAGEATVTAEPADTTEPTTTSGPDQDADTTSDVTTTVSPTITVAPTVAAVLNVPVPAAVTAAVADDSPDEPSSSQTAVDSADVLPLVPARTKAAGAQPASTQQAPTQLVAAFPGAGQPVVEAPSAATPPKADAGAAIAAAPPSGATPDQAPAGFTATVAPTAVTPAATVAAAPTAPTSALPLPEQISRPLVALAKSGDGEQILTIKVTPENLGPVTVRAHVDGDKVRIDLFTPDAGREAVKHVLADLRRDLATAGMTANLNLSDRSAPDADSRQSGSDGRRDQPQPNGEHRDSRQSFTKGTTNRAAHTPTSALDVLA